MLRDIRLRRY